MQDDLEILARPSPHRRRRELLKQPLVGQKLHRSLTIARIQPHDQNNRMPRFAMQQPRDNRVTLDRIGSRIRPRIAPPLALVLRVHDSLAPLVPLNPEPQIAHKFFRPSGSADQDGRRPLRSENEASLPNFSAKGCRRIASLSAKRAAPRAPPVPTKAAPSATLRRRTRNCGQ